MKDTLALITAVLICAVGVTFFPAPHRASAGQIKQLGLAIINYGDLSLPDPDRLLSNDVDKYPGLLLTEKNEVVEAVAFQVRDNDFLFIQLGTGETVRTTVIWSHADDLLLMDDEGGLALFIIL